jgi:hypothetical protein
MSLLPLDRPWKRHQPCSFLFFISVFNIWKTSKYKNESNLLLVPITVCIEYFLPIGGRTFICWKNAPKGCTILVRIAGCWNSSNILLNYEQLSKEQLLTFWHFWSMVWLKRSWFVPIQTVIRTSRRLDSFLYETAQNFEVFSKIQN